MQDIKEQETISIKIVSATYGPCEVVRLLTGELAKDDSASIPLSRDVAPFLRALLRAARTREEAHWTEDNTPYYSDDIEQEEDSRALPQIVRGITKSFIFLLGGGRSMNEVFGDPSPGISKRLAVHYFVTEASVTEVHHVTFAEHERVVLRRRLIFFQDDSKLKMAVAHSSDVGQLEMKNDSSDSDHQRTILEGRRMGRSQSIAEFASAINSKQEQVRSSSWRLRSAVSEMVLPLILPFLKFPERVGCRLVCRCWKHIVREWGVATTIDSNDRNISNFSRPFLKGILSHSYGLHTLILSGFASLEKEDLHPAIPHLRNLRWLDISRCVNLDDSSMLLLSEHVFRTLEVLYIKGLEKVSNDGVKAICNACNKLEVLEISYVPITDDAGVAIQKLPRLRALFMRDNYDVTNESIDVITAKCKRLSQLTLWGCIKMKRFQVPFSDSKLVILNFWGCYNLNDDSAETFGNMANLSSLIVCECHRLTDRFVEILSRTAPQLNHLHMRYCKRLTDRGINLIATNMSHLYSLDLSFCTRLTAISIFNLLDTRFESLSEIRLKNCTQLDILRTLPMDAGTRGGSDGIIIANVIRSHPGHCLSVLDLRECGGSSEVNRTQYPETDPFVISLTALDFEQRVPGFFCRPARWSSVQRQLVEHISSQQRIIPE